MPNFDNKADLAALLLRLVAGAWFLVHGLTKLLVFTPPAPPAISSRWACRARWVT